MAFLKIVPLVLCIVGFGLSAVSTFSSEWLVFYENGTFFGSAGHFRLCNDEFCVLRGSVLLDSHIERASLIFSVAGFIALFVATILLSAGMFNKWQRFMNLGWGSAMTGVVASIISVAVYAGNASNVTTVPPEVEETYTYSFGYSFIIQCCVPVVVLIGGVLALTEKKEGKEIISKIIMLNSTSASDHSEV